MNNKKFFPALTGIRAISAYGIYFFHNSVSFSNPGPNRLLSQFYTFIPVLFVLSGFVICYKYYSPVAPQKKELYNYFISRFTRIIPIFFILTTATFLLQYLKHSHTGPVILKTWLYNIFLLKGFSSKYVLTGIGPGWSLSVEELFYTLCPLLFFKIAKPSSLLRLVLIFYAAGVLITFCFIRINFEGFFSSYQFIFYLTFFGRIFEFACGMYLALIVRGKFRDRLASLAKWTLPAGLAIMILSIAAQYFIAGYYHTKNAVAEWPGIFCNNISMPAGITLLLYSLIYRETGVKKFLSLGVIVALGNATYSFYLLHTSFLNDWIIKFLGRNILIDFPAMVIAAYVFYIIVERPLTRYLRKKLYRP